MKNETDTTPSTAPAPPVKATPAEPTLACTVLVTGTTIGKAILASGHKLRLPKSKAETLAGLTPPRVAITGL